MNPESENKSLQRATYLIEIYRYREAIKELNNCLFISPNNQHAFYKLALCYYELDELKTALEFAKKAINANPSDEQGYHLMSIIYRTSGDHHQALAAAESCINQSPFSLYAMQNLAYSQINLFRLDEAQKTIDEMLKYFPNESLTHDACGYLALKKEDWADAENHFQRALQIEPTSFITLNNLGHIYINQAKKGREFGSRLSKHQKAIKYFELAINSKPTFLEAQRNLKIANDTNFYFGSKMFWIMIRNSCLMIGLLCLMRLTFESIPLIINFFTPYKPQFFYLGVNFISILQSIIILSSVFSYYYRKSLGYQMQNRFENASKPGIAAFILLFTIPQFLGAIFFAVIELDPPGIIWFSYILFSFGTFFTALKIFQYIDNKEII